MGEEGEADPAGQEDAEADPEEGEREGLAERDDAAQQQQDRDKLHHLGEAAAKQKAH